MGVSRDCPFFVGGGRGGDPLLSEERVKLRTSNFVGTFIGSIGTKAHENVGNSSRMSRKFSVHPCVGRNVARLVCSATKSMRIASLLGELHLH